MNVKLLFAGFLLLSAFGCGKSSSDSIRIRGTIIQGESKEYNMLAHEAGERIPGVQICALGSCDTTNRNGVWSLGFRGTRIDEVLFSVKEHGADTTFTLNIPQQAKNVEIEMSLHTEAGYPHDEDGDHHLHEDEEEHSHDHEHDHSHRFQIKHANHWLPENDQITVLRVIIDGMDYDDALDFYSHHEDEHQHDHDDDHHHDHEHDHEHD